LEAALMAKEPLSDFLETLMHKYVENSTFVNDPTNIVMGESLNGLIHKNDDMFPRLELLITKLKFDGYIDQRNMNQGFRFSVAGHLRRDSNDTIPQDMWDAVRWGRELVQILFTLNDDRIAGNPPCDGYIQMGGFPEVFFEYELFPKITSVILIAEAEIQLSDTFTNN
jgi:hypothetical protein